MTKKLKQIKAPKAIIDEKSLEDEGSKFPPLQYPSKKSKFDSKIPISEEDQNLIKKGPMLPADYFINFQRKLQLRISKKEDQDVVPQEEVKENVEYGPVKAPE